jgi:hypothetical protein
MDDDKDYKETKRKQLWGLLSQEHQPFQGLYKISKIN